MTQPNDGLNDRIEINLFQEYNPKEEVDQGGFKTHDVQYSSDDGGLMHYSGKDTPYTVSVERILAVDGWEDATKTQAMTLLVLGYSAKCNDEDGRFASIWSWIDLEDSKETTEDEKAAPKVEAWAPFASEQRWNETKDAVHTEHGTSAGIGGGAAGVNANVAADARRARDTREVFFDKGLTTKRFSDVGDRRLNGVKWFLTDNKSLKKGVPPDFRLAVLFKRKSDKPFDLTFGFRCTAGTWENIKETILHWFGKGKNINKTYLYTPNSTPRSRNREGEDLLRMVVPENLGQLIKKDDEELQKLTSVWGLGPIKPEDEQVIETEDE